MDDGFCIHVGPQVQQQMQEKIRRRYEEVVECRAENQVWF
jgi:hypothetical protein